MKTFFDVYCQIESDKFEVTTFTPISYAEQNDFDGNRLGLQSL